MSMKNRFLSSEKKYLDKNDNNNLDNIKSTNINVLLNRVKLDQKKESRKKILFTVTASMGLVIFGVLIF